MIDRTTVACLLLLACAATTLPAGEERAQGTGLRVYHDEMGTTIFGRILFAYDAAPDPNVSITIPLSSITDPGHATAADFLAATSWDFSPVAGLPKETVVIGRNTHQACHLFTSC